MVVPMKFNTFGYTLRQGIANIWRNKMFSIASIATMAACIFMFGLFYSLLSNFRHVVNNVESDVAITVFFEDGLDQRGIDKIGMAIAESEEVASFRFVSADDAWEEYKIEYLDGDEEAAQGFGEDNPLANSANYQIYMKNIEQQQTLVDSLKTLPGVRSGEDGIKQSEQVANTLTDFNRLVSVISGAIILILICVAIFLISNTVRTGITVRRGEIRIMKLIGATDFFVRAPFIIEGILIGLIGSIIPLVIIYAMYGRIITSVSSKFGFLSSIINFVPAHTIFSVLIPVSLILGVGIGYAGSRFTVHRHINV